MSSLTSAEWQGLAATLVGTPILIVAIEKTMASVVGGDLGILLGSVVGAVAFGLVPIIAARTLGRAAPITELRPLRG
ncbi:hypothetical protein [uncultured Alsobacter sp.]|uniref:hypothetical protein n=1 Tax=uncultured Alsobacter sp. TaxID=1748258 RepID=UPI0025DDF0E6|nr:hypothetical protein [uncultured Alsobacter sp.]